MPNLVDGVRVAFPHGATVLVARTPPEIQRAYSIPDAECEIPPHDELGRLGGALCAGAAANLRSAGNHDL